MIKLSLKIERRNNAWMEEGLGAYGPGATKGHLGLKSGASSGSLRGGSSGVISNTGSKGWAGSGSKSVNQGRSLGEATRSGIGSNKVGENSGFNGRRLSQAELQERSRKGLCFKCEEKWNAEHKCKTKQLNLLVIDEEEEEEEEKDEHGMADSVLEQIKEDEEMALQLSMQSLIGLSSSQTMNVWGWVNGEKMVVLIDCGASNSFIRKNLAQILKLQVDETPKFLVEVGDGHKVACKGVCHEVEIEMQGVKVRQDLFLFELGGADIVLGLDWLSSLGEIKANFKERTLRYDEEGREVLIKATLP